MTKLIEKAKKGNKKAKEEIYKATCGELFCYCRQLCGNESDAQDLMQDTYLIVFEKLEQYRRDDNFKGWLHTIALHKFYNKIRAEKPQLRTDEVGDEMAEESELYAPEGYAEKKEIQRILSEIISENLSDTQRIAVILYYYDEMSIGDIAKELDCPEGTIKTRLYHSRKIIKDELFKRGIVLGGSVLLISAALKAYSASFVVSAASASVTAGSIIGKNIAGTAVKSAVAITKGKIIVGAAAVAVAGGSVGVYHVAKNDSKETVSEKPVITTAYSVVTEAPTLPTAVVTPTEKPTQPPTEPTTEEPTGISETGGTPLDYHLDANNLVIMIPENYTPTMYGKSKNEDGSYSLIKMNILDVQRVNTTNRNIFTTHVNNVLKFKPDSFSGDEILYMARRLEEPEDIDVKTELDFFYDDVVLSESQEIKIKMDNTNSPESPTEKAANSYSFTAKGGKLQGTALVVKGNLDNTHIFVFSDCSGVRQEEYQTVIDSIELSFQDNSWRDRYNIPENFN